MQLPLRSLKLVKAKLLCLQFWRQLRSSSSFSLRFLLSTLCVVLVLVVCNFGRERIASPQSSSNGTGFMPANTTQLLSKPNAMGVKVGAYFDNLHDLSLKNRRFNGSVR